MHVIVAFDSLITELVLKYTVLPTMYLLIEDVLSSNKKKASLSMKKDIGKVQNREVCRSKNIFLGA